MVRLLITRPTDRNAPPMPDSLDTSLFDAEVFTAAPEAWLILLGAWTLAALVLIGFKAVIGSRLGRLSDRTANTLDDYVAAAVRATKLYFLITVGLYLAVRFVGWPALRGPVATLVFLVLLLQIIQWGNTLIRLWTDQYKARKGGIDGGHVTAAQAIAFLGRLTLLSIVLLVALDNFGIDVTALVAGLGVGGIAIALAVQNVLKDLFAYISILLDEPFVYGDFLIVGDFLGSVEKIGIKTTRLRSLSGEQLVFSNDDLLNSRIRNYKRMQERRVVFTVGVVYETSREQLAALPEILREAVEAQDKVRFDRAHFKSFADFSLVFEVVYYVLDPDYNLYMDIQQAINLQLFARFEEEGIAFAYPTRTVYVQGQDGQAAEPEAHRP